SGRQSKLISTQRFIGRGGWGLGIGGWGRGHDEYPYSVLSTEYGHSSTARAALELLLRRCGGRLCRFGHSGCCRRNQVPAKHRPALAHAHFLDAQLAGFGELAAED